MSVPIVTPHPTHTLGVCPPVGVSVTSFSTGFVAGDFNFGNVNWGGCPGASNPTFDTQGNECVDIKEGATANVVEHNDCTGQKDPESAGFDSRGSGNVFRFNASYANLGAGVRLGGDSEADGAAAAAA